MLKDLKLSQAAADDVAARTALGLHATQIFDAFVAAGGAESDFSGVVNFIRSAPQAG